MLSLFRALRLRNVGFLEMLLAIYPILAAYSYGSFRLAYAIVLVIDIFLLISKKVILLKYKPLFYFTFFFIIHQLIWFLFLGVRESYFVNQTIGALIILVSIFIITPVIDFKKLEGSVNWVSVIVLIGLFYHVVLVARGFEITPIKVPFLPTPLGEESRVSNVLSRPVSFFMEPQSYASYMLFTMFFAMYSRNIFWFALVALSVILSTSTTGLVMIPIMVIFFVISGHSKTYVKIFIIFVAIGLGYFLTKSQFASSSWDKATTTELETTARTINGPVLTISMKPSDLILGVQYANATDYYYSQTSGVEHVVPNSTGRVYVSAFWNALLLYGIIGWFLFFLVFLGVLKINKGTIPLLACLIVASFSNPDMLGAVWAFQMIYILSYSKNSLIDEITNINYTIRQ